MHLDVSSVKWQPFCPGGDELTRAPHNLANLQNLTIFVTDYHRVIRTKLCQDPLTSTRLTLLYAPSKRAMEYFKPCLATASRNLLR